MYTQKAPSWRLPKIQARIAPAPPHAEAPAQDRFLICLPDILIQECPDPGNWTDPKNFSDDPHDPGGATMCGIIQVEYDAYRKSLGQPTQSVRLITQAEGEAIYRMNYWEPHCPQLPVGLDLSFFDSSVNMGGEQAIKILQFALGNIAVDGIWGPQTAGAVTAIISAADVINAFTARRKAVYESFSTFKYFGTDWIRRATQIGDQSIQMAAPGVAAAVAAAPAAPV
jgi:lysozyme family protein